MLPKVYGSARLSFLLSGIVLMGVSACDSASATRGRLTNSYPLDRARAAVKVAETGDPAAVDALIELLEDNDEGVRLYSILALERLCKETYGYRYYDNEAGRSAAVARWREARKRGEVAVHGHRLAATENGGAADAGESVSAEMDESQTSAP